MRAKSVVAVSTMPTRPGIDSREPGSTNDQRKSDATTTGSTPLLPKVTCHVLMVAWNGRFADGHHKHCHPDLSAVVRIRASALRDQPRKYLVPLPLRSLPLFGASTLLLPAGFPFRLQLLYLLLLGGCQAVRRSRSAASPAGCPSRSAPRPAPVLSIGSTPRQLAAFASPCAAPPWSYATAQRPADPVRDIAE